MIANIVVRTSHEKSSTDFKLWRTAESVAREYISGQVFAHQLIVRLILVERFDDIIAKRPQPIDGYISLKAVAFAETNNI